MAKMSRRGFAARIRVRGGTDFEFHAERAGAAKTGHQGVEPHLAGLQPAGVEHHESARHRRQAWLRARRKTYPSISAFYAAFATGETDVLIGGPTILQKLYQEGVPVRIIATGFTLADLVIFAKDEKIKSLRRPQGQAARH